MFPTDTQTPTVIVSPSSVKKVNRVVSDTRAVVYDVYVSFIPGTGNESTTKIRPPSSDYYSLIKVYHCSRYFFCCMFTLSLITPKR